MTPMRKRKRRTPRGHALAIRVLDDHTARRVRAVVPARVTITITPTDRRLLEMSAIADADDDDRPLRRMPF
jgi:hypothetical protein